MPHLRIETNVPRERIPAELANEAAKLVAKTTGKPLSYCAATIVPDVIQSFGGKEDPTAQATMMSIGCISPELNQKHSKEIASFVEKHLGVPSNRMYIHFVNAKGSDIGYSGVTF